MRGTKNGYSYLFSIFLLLLLLLLCCSSVFFSISWKLLSRKVWRHDWTATRSDRGAKRAPSKCRKRNQRKIKNKNAGIESFMIAPFVCWIIESVLVYNVIDRLIPLSRRGLNRAAEASRQGATLPRKLPLSDYSWVFLYWTPCLINNYIKDT